jgi:hypothetical protein
VAGAEQRVDDEESVMSSLAGVTPTITNPAVQTGLAVADPVADRTDRLDLSTTVDSVPAERVSRRRRIVSELSKHAPAAAAGQVGS